MKPEYSSPKTKLVASHPALKRKANYLVKDLEDQFKRMKNRWDGLSSFESGLETDFEATFLVLKAKFEDSQHYDLTYQYDCTSNQPSFFSA